MRRPKHQIISEEETLKIIHSWAKKDDRGAAISAGAHVEDKLGTAIKVRFVQLPAKGDVAKRLTEAALFDGYGPLASFFAKIDIGFALGLYNAKTRFDLHVIRSIRNDFAHAVEDITFADNEVIRKCEKLSSKNERQRAEPQIKELQEQHHSLLYKIVYILACSYYVGKLDGAIKRFMPMAPTPPP